MIDVDERIRAEVDRLVPAPSGFAADWGDVLTRSGPSRPSRAGRRRLLVLAATVAAVLAVIAATPLGAALARTLDDFSAWIAGDPGSPASPAEQRAFQEANGRSWAGFPAGTELRRLLETTVGDTELTLYGFRSGDSLCLRLTAKGIDAAALHCAPVRDLQNAATPALVVAADEGLGGGDLAGGKSPFMTTFGIVSDGVERVEVHADDGDHDAVLGGNAFLYVADHPKLGVRVRGIDAIAGDGSRAALGFESAPYGLFDLGAPPTGSFHGPSAVERHVTGGTIGWLERLEPRGSEVPAELRERIDGMIGSQVEFARRGARAGFPGLGPIEPPHQLMARALHPEPGSPLTLVLIAASPGTSMEGSGSQVCRYLVVGQVISGSCGPLTDLFSRGPLSFSIGGGGGSQYSRLAGLASDDVAAVKLYLGDGRVVDVPLDDNFFSAQVARSDYPLRVAAYDDTDRVIGLESFRSDGMTSPAPPQAGQTVRPLMTLTGPNGGTARLEAGDVVGGYRCWRLAIGPNGSESGGCTPWPVKGPTPLAFVAAYRTTGDVFLAGPLPLEVASVEIRYPDGTGDTVETPDGFLVSPIPAAQLDRDTLVIDLHAYDANGAQVAQRGVGVTR